MKIKIAKILAVIIAMVALVFCCLFPTLKRWCFLYYNSPYAQPNTTWISTDKNIKITITKTNSEQIDGRIFYTTSHGIEECLFVQGLYAVFDVYSLDASDRLGMYEEEHYESWRYLSGTNSEFTIRVDKSKFLSIGEEIVFHKLIDGSLSDD